MNLEEEKLGEANVLASYLFLIDKYRAKHSFHI